MRENNVSAAGSMTRAKRWRFTAITIALPLLLLLVIEAGLRIAGYGADYRLFVPVLDHPDYLVSNVEIGKRYFGSGPFAPTPQLDFFRARKELGTFRIVFQGESSALGFPYTHGAAPSRMLEQRLQASFPGKNIEVINTALTAVNSYTLLDEANEIIAQHPDAVMIYTGHNEYYGAFGSASSGRFGGGRLLVKSYLAIRRLRLGQLLSNAVARLMSPKQLATDDSAPRTVMQLMAGEQTVPFGSPQYRAGLEQFRANIRDLLSRYQSHGIPVFIGTVASNERDQAPFISGLSAGTDSLAWNALYRSAAAALSRGDSSGAQASLESAIAKDSTQAAAFYLLARIREARGDFVRARVLYREAKDRDELRFRAPEAINDIIRSEARKSGAHVVETKQALERASPAGIVGHSLMLEHLHPNIDGYFIIADAFFRSLRNAIVIGDSPRADNAAEARANVPVTPVDSIIGFFHTDRLISGWPFQPKGVDRIPVVDTLRAGSPLEQLAQAVVLQKMSWPEAMDRQRAYFEQAGDYDRAVAVALVMAQEYRYSPQPLVDAARIEVGRHKYNAALRYTLAAISRQETPKTLQLAGLLLLRQGDQARALEYLKKAADLSPNDQRMVVPLRSAQVLPDLELARAATPKDTTVLYTLAAAYALTEQYEKSRETIAALRAISPSNARALQLLARLPKDSGTTAARSK